MTPHANSHGSLHFSIYKLTCKSLMDVILVSFNKCLRHLCKIESQCLHIVWLVTFISNIAQNTFHGDTPFGCQILSVWRKILFHICQEKCKFQGFIDIILYHLEFKTNLVVYQYIVSMDCAYIWSWRSGNFTNF